ncbi:hypothetical protein [Mycobacteroides abscessus]|uniref:hypothetical protein n=1 Tax=Mycobacteroides abscessus TaxID=36809 RepID=UPI0012FFEB9E|nr:hypothetical protein [Mycobacteroides abscessus]
MSDTTQIRLVIFSYEGSKQLPRFVVRVRYLDQRIADTVYGGLVVNPDRDVRQFAVVPHTEL